MRVFQLIGAINILIGIVWLLAPMKFYSAAMGLFTPEVSPPFDASAVNSVTVLLLLPAIIFMVNGIAIFFMGLRFDRVPELKVFKETGEYVGRVKSVEEKKGEIEKFLVEDEEEIRKKDDILSMDDVILVKSDAEGGITPERKHEFMGLEVYDKNGDYFGKVESVTLDDNFDATEILAVRGDSKKIFKTEEFEPKKDVIIIKS